MRTCRFSHSSLNSLIHSVFDIGFVALIIIIVTVSFWFVSHISIVFAYSTFLMPFFIWYYYVYLLNCLSKPFEFFLMMLCDFDCRKFIITTEYSKCDTVFSFHMKLESSSKNWKKNHLKRMSNELIVLDSSIWEMFVRYKYILYIISI